MVKRKGQPHKDDLGVEHEEKKLKVELNSRESFHEEDNKGKTLLIEEKNNVEKKLKVEANSDDFYHEEDNKGEGLLIEDKNTAKKTLNIESSRKGKADESFHEEDNEGEALLIEEKNSPKKKQKLKSNRKCIADETFHEEDKRGKRLQIEEKNNAKKKLKVESSRKGNADESFHEEDNEGKGLQVEEKDNANKRKKRKLKCAVKRAKKLKKVKLVKEQVETKDYLSELPDHIVHHILGLLQNPKDVARTSVLSKKWKSMWASFPIFDYDQRCCRPRAAGRNSRRSCAKGLDVENFKAVVNKSIATRLDAIPSIEKFKLHVLVNSTEFAPSMNYWILAAVTKNVQELEIHVHRGRVSYSLPQSILSSKTITSLKLYGVKLGYATTINVDNLRVLSIKAAPISADMIGKFINNCPLIEDLRLVNCHGLGKLNILRHPKLRRVELYKCRLLTDVDIDAPNLETFWFYEWRVDCKISLVTCTNLKCFTLKHSYITDELFQNQLSMYPNLEKLELLECTKLERITILSDKIKQLSLLRCFKLEEINIDAPHLTSLEYTGDKAPFSSMNIGSLHGAKLNILSLNKKKCYLHGLESFLGKFTKYKGFKLLVCAEKTLTIYEEFRGNMSLPSRSCKFEFTKSSRKLRDLVASFLSETPPSTLTVQSSAGSEILQFVQELIESREKNPSCCKYHSNKCWRHYLEDAKLSRGTPDKRTYKLTWKPKAMIIDF